MAIVVRRTIAATYVRDIDASRAFYELLGFHEMRAGKATISTWSVMRHGNQAVLLASTRPPLKIPQLPLLFYFSFEDLEAVVSGLGAASVDVDRLCYPRVRPAAR